MSALKGAENYVQVFLVFDFCDSTNDVNAGVFCVVLFSLFFCFFFFFCSFQDAFAMRCFIEIRDFCLCSPCIILRRNQVSNYGNVTLGC